jgi:hypothetical protein
MTVRAVGTMRLVAPRWRGGPQTFRAPFEKRFGLREVEPVGAGPEWLKNPPSAMRTNPSASTSTLAGDNRNTFCVTLGPNGHDLRSHRHRERSTDLRKRPPGKPAAAAKSWPLPLGLTCRQNNTDRTRKQSIHLRKTQVRCGQIPALSKSKEIDVGANDFSAGPEHSVQAPRQWARDLLRYGVRRKQKRRRPALKSAGRRTCQGVNPQVT